MSNWMDILGFKYEPRRKTYYVDGHEKPETVRYRSEFVKRYLRNELKCFRWIQLCLEDVQRLEQETAQSKHPFSRKIGYEYTDPDTDGTTAPMPKDAGEGVMLSSFVSRDFGYGYRLTPTELITLITAPVKKVTGRMKQW